MKRSLSIRITERDPRPAEIATTPDGYTAIATRLDIVATGFTEANAAEDFTGLIIPLAKMLPLLGATPAEVQQLIRNGIAECIHQHNAETAADAIIQKLNANPA